MKNNPLPLRSLRCVAFSNALLLVTLLICLVSVVKGESTKYVAKVYAGGGLCDGSDATLSPIYYPGFIYSAPNSTFIFGATTQNRIRQIKNGIITTLAGNGQPGFSGDGGDAKSAKLYSPSGVVMNSKGELIFCDHVNNRVRKVDTKGIITTIAGTGLDKPIILNGADATKIPIGSPIGITIDRDDVIYFTENTNILIRKLFGNGTITTIAGNGNGISGTGGENITAKGSSIHSPTGIFWHPNSGEIYFTEKLNHRVRKITKDGKLVTVAGIQGTPGYEGEEVLATSSKITTPIGIAVNEEGEVVFSEIDGRIRKILTNGTMISLARGFTGTYGVCFSSTGEVVFTEVVGIYKCSNNGTVRIAGTGTSSTYCLGNGDPKNIPITTPVGLFVDGKGIMYFTDAGNRRVYQIRNGIVSTFAGNGGSTFNGDAIDRLSAQLNPSSIFVTPDSEILLTDTTSNRVRKISTSGMITTIAGNGSPNYNGDNVNATKAAIGTPYSVIMDSFGQIYVADYNNRVRKIFTNGTIITIAGTGTYGYNGEGILAINAQLKRPAGLAINTEGELFISEMDGNRVRKILRNGTIVTVAGTGQIAYNGDGIDATTANINGPRGISLSPNGDLYITETPAHKIRKVFANGTITTLLGLVNNVEDFSGNDPLSTKLYYPLNVFAKSNGEVLVADSGTSLIRIYSFECYGLLASDPNVCNGNGQCFSTNQCNCNAGWSGIDCLIPACFGIPFNDTSVCSSKGECISSNHCNCNISWSGIDCSLPKCFNISSNESLVCNGNGKCTNIDKCECSNGWNGTDCSISTFTSQIIEIIVLKCFNISSNETSVCNGHGKCNSTNQCNCNAGWGGIDCSMPKCFNISSNETSLVCNGNGKCSNIDKCECLNGWNGTDCSISTFITSPISVVTKCFNISSNESLVCNGNGKCINIDSCQCFSGWNGKTCSDRVILENNETSDTEKGKNENGINSEYLLALIALVAVPILLIIILFIVILCVIIVRKIKRKKVKPIE